MKFISLILTVAFIICIQGCTVSRPLKISAVASPEQEVGYKETITSQKKHFVSVAPHSERFFSRSKASFILYIKNCGDSPIEIGTHDVIVGFSECIDDGDPRNINSPSAGDPTYPLNRDFPKIEAAAYKKSSTQIIRTPYVFGNTAYITWRSDIPEKSLIRTIANQYRFGRQREVAKKLYFRPQTLLPGESESGLLVCDTRTMNPNTEGAYKLLVSISDEQHEFIFNRDADTGGT
jgi:hypothetical protein